MQLEMSGPWSSPIETLSHLSTMLQKSLCAKRRGWGVKQWGREEKEESKTNENVLMQRITDDRSSTVTKQKPDSIQVAQPSSSYSVNHKFTFSSEQLISVQQLLGHE